MYSSDFNKGVILALEKRAAMSLDSGWLAMLNAAANIKGLSDISNKALQEAAEEKQEKPVRKPAKKSKKLSMTIDKELLVNLTPEQRKRLYFAVRKVKPV